jgi:hypothetical protein
VVVVDVTSVVLVGVLLVLGLGVLLLLPPPPPPLEPVMLISRCLL